MMMRHPCFLVALLLLALPAGADELILRNGSVFRGVVRQEGRTVKVTMENGSVTFQIWQVKEMRITGDPLRDYKRKKDAATSAADWFELGAWARDNGLPGRAKEAFRRAIELDPDHSGARFALGYQKHEGRWMTPDESMAARGFVKVGVGWIHRESYERQKRDEARRRLEADRLATTERIARMQRDVDMALVALERERLEADRRRSRVAYPTSGFRFFTRVRAVPTTTRIVRPAPRRSADPKECDREEDRGRIVVPAPSCNGRGGSVPPAVVRWPAPITGRWINR